MINEVILKFYRNGAYICNETVYNTSYENLQVGSNLVPNCYLSDYKDIKADEVVIMINTGRYDKPIYFESKHIKVNVDITARSISNSSTPVNSTPKKEGISDLFNLNGFTQKPGLGYAYYYINNMDCHVYNPTLKKIALFDITIFGDDDPKNKRYVLECKGHKIYVQDDLEGYYYVDDADYCVTIKYHLMDIDNYEKLESSQTDTVKDVFDKILK
ncbi:MAG: hypothetical protein CfClM3_0583 [Methanobrevibacter sp. CfCl-M3]